MSFLQLPFPLFVLLIGLAGQSQTKLAYRYKMSHEIDSLAMRDPANMTLETAAWELSFIGLYKKALISFDVERADGIGITTLDSTSFIDSFKIEDARKVILENAKNRRIIIFNEAHHNPRNRVFVASLLMDLKAVGYNCFAAEAFGYNINDGAASLLHSGYFTREPQYGNLVREALALNYVLYPYEVRTPIDGKEREIVQAQNISKLLLEDSNAKIIVYCGFAHAYKGDLPNWQKAMAGRLKEITNIDPFCIDQILLTERGIPSKEDGYYKLISSTFRPTTYSAFIKRNGSLFRSDQVDMDIYYPPTRYIGNRPGWVFENNKTPYYLKLQQVKIAFPILVKAYNVEDDVSVMVPIDVIEIKKKTELAGTSIAVNKQKPTVLVVSNRQGAHQVLELQ